MSHASPRFNALKAAVAGLDPVLAQPAAPVAAQKPAVVVVSTRTFNDAFDLNAQNSSAQLQETPMLVGGCFK